MRFRKLAGMFYASQVARMVTKHFQELHQKELRAEREDVLKMKRVAGSIAKIVREFWSNIEKVGSAAFPLFRGDLDKSGKSRSGNKV